MNRMDMISAVVQCMNGGSMTREQVVRRLRAMGLESRRKVYKHPAVRAAYYRIRLQRSAYYD